MTWQQNGTDLPSESQQTNELEELKEDYAKLHQLCKDILASASAFAKEVQAQELRRKRLINHIRFEVDQVFGPCGNRVRRKAKSVKVK